jgi:uncharacterized ion transporter superfamily protein YfcC
VPNPWVSLRRDQLNPVNKVVNEKEQLEKGLEEEEEKKDSKFTPRDKLLLLVDTTLIWLVRVSARGSLWWWCSPRRA